MLKMLNCLGMKPHAWFFALALAAMPLCAQAALTYDIQIPAGGITVDHTNIFVGQTAKIYVNVDNIGTNDVEGTAVFKEDGVIIGQKAISAKATGRVEEIWQNWKPTTVGNHVIEVAISPDTPDATPENNSGQITIFVDKDTDHDGIGDSVDPDIDGDGVPNGQDQFPLDPTRSKDTDGDGIDDSIDSDIDNDGLYNWEETKIGTDPTKYDTDGDHVSDKEDAFPLDPKRWDPEPAPTSNTSGGGSSGSQTPSDNPTNSGSSGSGGSSSSNTQGSGSSGSSQTDSGTNPSDAGTSNGSAGGLDTSTSNSQGADGQVLGIKIFGATSTDALLSATSTAELVMATSSQEIANDQAQAVQPQSDDQADVSDKKSWNLSLALWGVAIVFGVLAGLFIWLAKRRKEEDEKEVGSRK